jgi:hypothetical protein
MKLRALSQLSCSSRTTLVMLPPRMLYFHLAFGVVLLFGSQKTACHLKTEGQFGTDDLIIPLLRVASRRRGRGI